MDQQVSFILAILFVALIVFILGPFITIWSLNSLFGLNIVYYFSNWLASGWLTCIMVGRIKFKSN